MKTLSQRIAISGPFVALLLSGIHSGLLAQSSLDTSFTLQPIGNTSDTPNRQDIISLATDVEGRIYAGGDFLRLSNITLTKDVALFLPNGTVISTFAANPDELEDTDGKISGVVSIAPKTDGTVYATGYFSDIGFKIRDQAARLSSLTGRADTDLDNFEIDYPEDDDVVISTSLAPLDNGTLLVWGSFTELDGRNQRGIGMVGRDGSFLNSFRPLLGPGTGLLPFTHEVTTAVVLPGGSIVFGGAFSSVNLVIRKGIAKVSSTGILDAGFLPAVSFDLVTAIAPLPDGDLLIAGLLAGTTTLVLVRLNEDGSVDGGFPQTTTGLINTIIPRTDGRILVAGNFTEVGGTPRSDIALLEENGSVSASYEAESTNGYINAAAIQADGKVLVGGMFTSASGTARKSLARYAADGSVAQEVTVDADGTTLNWNRSGPLPEVVDMYFEQSLDTGKIFTRLGKGTRSGSNWQLTGQSIPGGKDVVVRAVGRYGSGRHNASTSLISSKLTVNRPLPTITDQPDSQAVVLGASGVSFTVVASSAATITGYQWRRNGVNISGANGTSYTIPHSITTADAGTYTVVVTSTAGSRTSAGAVLTVVTPIAITKQPVNVDVALGKTATFSVTATGTSPQYQWYKGMDPVGTNKSTFSIPNAQFINEANDYHVVVSNLAGSVPSNMVSLDVVVAPVVNTPPAHQLVGVGDPATFSAMLTIESPRSFSWLKNTKVFTSTPGPSLVIPSTQLSDAGKYALKATNAAGSVTTSPPAELGVVDDVNPTKVVVGEGLTAVLKAPVAGNGLTVTWRLGMTTITASPPRITLSPDGRTLTIRQASLTTNDNGAYVVDVTGPPGPMPIFTSAPVNLVITTTAPEIDTMTLNLPHGMVGAPYDGDGAPGAPFVPYQIPTVSNPLQTATKYFASPLPPGLKLDSATGRISGTPTKAGDWTVKIKASNANGTSAEVTDTIHSTPCPRASWAATRRSCHAPHSAISMAGRWISQSPRRAATVERSLWAAPCIRFPAVISKLGWVTTTPTPCWPRRPASPA